MLQKRHHILKLSRYWSVGSSPRRHPRSVCIQSNKTGKAAEIGQVKVPNSLDKTTVDENITSHNFEARDTSSPNSRISDQSRGRPGLETVGSYTIMEVFGRASRHPQLCALCPQFLCISRHRLEAHEIMSCGNEEVRDSKERRPQEYGR